MGVDLSDLLPKRKLEIKDLSGKSLAIDAYNAIYQFLAIIRGESGEPLMDRRGNVTSHLSGLLYRTSNLVEMGIRPVYVFDGKPPELKEAEIRRRREIKEEAILKYEEALRAGDLAEAKKYAQMTSQLKGPMVEDAKRLLTAMGIPWVQAPSEGEAQAAHMAIRGDVWATVSQDHDSLLFGTPRLVRNLAITGKRKLPGKDLYVEVEPELIELAKVLSELGVDRERLVDIGILVGTDFNPDGIRGIGPKRALKLVKEAGGLEGALARLGIRPGFDPIEIKRIFLEPEVTSDYRLEWREPDEGEVISFLCGERDFSEARVRNALERMRAGIKRATTTRTLDSFFR
ncbi:MAG: flap endonuclease-1 [Candidatus Bathyarchaeia archaeon]